jgi:hypothetical protein
MTFNCTPTVFLGLKKELADSHQAVMTAGTVIATTPLATPTVDIETGTITHDSVVADYDYDSHAGVLTVAVIHGGNLIVNHIIHSKVQAAIDTLKKTA